MSSQMEKNFFKLIKNSVYGKTIKKKKNAKKYKTYKMSFWDEK